ncbi:MAG TPA: Crp/Fnr family transcriptional regulator [Mycobacteriales bacterium]|nr:Crp/Fnr family transcriptional regulator [Mycobacteriales bacterium]
MRGQDVSALLRTTDLFSALDDEAASQLAKQMVTRNYRKGQTLVHQGDPGTALFVIVEGSVAVYVTSENGDRMTMTTLGPTDVLGEIALFDEGVRSASAEALEPTTVLVLSRAAFLDLLRGHPEIVDQVLRAMGSLVRRLSDQAADFVFLDLPGRVAKTLLRLAPDAAAAAGRPVEIAVTQSRLAEMVGGSRQSVNQILQNFQARGMLEVSGRRILVSDPEPLRRRAGISG